MDLINTRGAARFDIILEDIDQYVNAEHQFVCAKHAAEFGSHWHKQKGSLLYKSEQQFKSIACGMHAIGVKVKADRLRVITKDESEAILKVTNEFYPVGTPLCRWCRVRVELLSAEYQANNNGKCLRPKLKKMPAAMTFGIERTPSIAQDQCEQNEDEYTCNEPLRKKKKTAFFHQTKEYFDQLATEYGFNLNWPRKPFLSLYPSSQRRLAFGFRKLFDAITNVYISSSVEDASEIDKNVDKFKSMVISNRINQPVVQSHKLDEMLQQLASIYYSTDSHTERLIILSICTKATTLTHLQQFIPNLSAYMFTKANQYGTVFDRRADLYKPPLSKMRYRRESVQKFVSFITSDVILTDLPFGTTVLKFDTGEKQRIPLTIRKLVHERIIATYLKYLEENNELGNYQLSMSTYRRILKACTSKIRKSLQGINIYQYDGDNGFEELQKIISHTSMITNFDKEWSKITSQSLKEAKFYQIIPDLQLAYNGIDASGESNIIKQIKGWAIREKKGRVFFNERQRQFLIEKFNEGIERNVKYSPEEVSQMMLESNSFTVQEILDSRQIHSYFSRYASLREKALAAEEQQEASTTDAGETTTAIIDSDLENIEHVNIDDFMDNFPDNDPSFQPAYEAVQQVVDAVHNLHSETDEENEELMDTT